MADNTFREDTTVSFQGKKRGTLSLSVCSYMCKIIANWSARFTQYNIYGANHVRVYSDGNFINASFIFYICKHLPFPSI